MSRFLLTILITTYFFHNFITEKGFSSISLMSVAFLDAIVKNSLVKFINIWKIEELGIFLQNKNLLRIFFPRKKQANSNTTMSNLIHTPN